MNQDTLEDCTAKAEVIKSNDEVMSLFKNEQTDFNRNYLLNSCPETSELSG